MSRLARFNKEPKKIEFDFGNGQIEELIIKPFKTTDMELLVDMGIESKQTQTTHKIVKKVLKENIPDFTEEEYNNMDYSFVDKILNAVMSVNGMDVPTLKQEFIADIKAKQAKK